MAHYALLDENNIVTNVIVGNDEGFEDKDWEQIYGDFSAQVCKRTSINTTGNKHSQGKEPFRKNYAGIDMIYDVEGDGFYAPQPFDSWTLNQDTFIWEAPVEYPDDENIYNWNEETLSWDLITK